jgi:KDO2-lipid IV(A) lauroyltransferase
MDYFLFLIYKFFKFIISILPKVLIKIFLKLLAIFIYFVDIRHKKYAKANLDLVYQDNLNDKQKNDIIKKSYLNLVYNLYEFIENQTLTLEQLESKIKVENEDIILKAINENRKIILVSAHYGNWEYITSYISLKYKPTVMVGRDTNNKYFNEDIKKARSKHNSMMLSKHNSAKGLIKALKDDKIIGLATDQHIDPRKGEIVEFLGHKAIQANSSARLAVKFNAIIILVFFIQNDFRNYTIKFCQGIEPTKYNNDLKAITQEEANKMSEQILHKPELWFWQHRRFKEFYNEIYN